MPNNAKSKNVSLSSIETSVIGWATGHLVAAAAIAFVAGLIVGAVLF